MMTIETHEDKIKWMCSAGYLLVIPLKRKISSSGLYSKIIGIKLSTIQLPFPLHVDVLGELGVPYPLHHHNHVKAV